MAKDKHRVVVQSLEEGGGRIGAKRRAHTFIPAGSKAEKNFPSTIEWLKLKKKSLGGRPRSKGDQHARHISIAVVNHLIFCGWNFTHREHKRKKTAKKVGEVGEFGGGEKVGDDAKKVGGGEKVGDDAKKVGGGEKVGDEGEEEVRSKGEEKGELQYISPVDVVSRSLVEAVLKQEELECKYFYVESKLERVANVDAMDSFVRGDGSLEGNDTIFKHLRWCHWNIVEVRKKNRLFMSPRGRIFCNIMDACKHEMDMQSKGENIVEMIDCKLNFSGVVNDQSSLEEYLKNGRKDETIRIDLSSSLAGHPHVHVLKYLEDNSWRFVNVKIGKGDTLIWFRSHKKKVFDLLYDACVEQNWRELQEEEKRRENQKKEEEEEKRSGNQEKEEEKRSEIQEKDGGQEPKT